MIAVCVLYVLSGMVAMVLYLLHEKRKLMMNSPNIQIGGDEIVNGIAIAFFWPLALIVGGLAVISPIYQSHKKDIEDKILLKINEVAEKTLLYWERKGK